MVVWAKIFGIMVFIYSVVRIRSNGPISTELNLYFITLIPQLNEQPFDSQGKIEFVPSTFGLFSILFYFFKINFFMGPYKSALIAAPRLLLRPGRSSIATPQLKRLLRRVPQ